VPLQQDRPPNWDVWLLRKPVIWQAVALSLNIDPDDIQQSTPEMTYTRYFNEGNDFVERLEIVRDNYSEMMGQAPGPIRPSCDAQTDLFRFVRWVHARTRWELPSQLKDFEEGGAENKSKGALVTSTQSTPIPAPPEPSKPSPTTRRRRRATPADVTAFMRHAENLYKTRGVTTSIDEAVKWAADPARKLSREWARKIVQTLPPKWRQQIGGKKGTRKKGTA
jgi:hypothetical protein